MSSNIIYHEWVVGGKRRKWVGTDRTIKLVFIDNFTMQRLVWCINCNCETYLPVKYDTKYVICWMCRRAKLPFIDDVHRVINLYIKKENIPVEKPKSRSSIIRYFLNFFN